MKNLFIMLVFVFNYHFGFSQTNQNIDSTNTYAFKIRSSNRDSSRILSYQALESSILNQYERGKALAQLNLGIHYCNGNVLDSASSYLGKAFKNMQAVSDPHHLAINTWYMGKLYQKLGNFKRAFQYLDETEKLFRAQNNDQFLIYVLTEQGFYHEMQGNYPEALEYYLEIYDLEVKLNWLTKSRVFGNIASVYSKMGMHLKALEYAKSSYDLIKNSNNIANISFELSGIGSIFNHLENTDSALHYFNKSLGLAVQSKRKDLQSKVLVNIANVFNKKGDYNKAINYLLQAKPLGDGISLLDIYIQLSKNYDNQNNGDSSLFYIHRTVLLASRRGSKKHLQFAFEILMDHHASNQNFDSAFYYSAHFKEVSDSIYNERKDKNFGDLRVQLETLEKENEIQSLKFEQYESKVRYIILAVLTVFFVLIAVLVFINYKSKQKVRQKILETKKEELEVQLGKSRKKLSNHTLSMIQRNNTLEEIKQELQSIQSRSNGNADKGLQKINNIIGLNKSLENDWANFANLFSEIHNDFFVNFQKNHPELSNYEIRICALIKLKLSNKEIAAILNIEHKSVKMAKYRMKKKLDLKENDTLDTFVEKLTV